MTHKTAVLIAVAVASAAAAVSTATAQRSATPTVGVGQTKIGKILVDAHGHTLYFFTSDTSHIQCTSDVGCTKLWPPLLVTGKPIAGPGVNPKLLGTVHRTKPAGLQVTYNHRPLYRYEFDSKPGDLKGQAEYNYWFALSPNGKPNEKPAPAP